MFKNNIIHPTSIIESHFDDDIIFRGKMKELTGGNISDIHVDNKKLIIPKFKLICIGSNFFTNIENYIKVLNNKKIS